MTTRAGKCGAAACDRAPAWRIEFIAGGPDVLRTGEGAALTGVTLACRTHVDEMRALLNPYAVLEYSGAQLGAAVETAVAALGGWSALPAGATTADVVLRVVDALTFHRALNDRHARERGDSKRADGERAAPASHRASSRGGPVGQQGSNALRATERVEESGS